MKEVSEIAEISHLLRIQLKCYESCMKEGKNIEMNTYLPLIRSCCEKLQLDWQVITGVKNGYVFTDKTDKPETFIRSNESKKPEIAVSRDIIRLKCENCNKEIKGKRADAKYCSEACKNEKNRIR